MKDISADATNVPLESVLDELRTDTHEDAEVVYPEVIDCADGYSLSVTNKESEKEKTIESIGKIVEEYNKKYHLTLPTRFDDIKELISCIATRDQRDLYVVVLSEAADRIILATVTVALTTVATLMSQLTNQSLLNNATLEERVGIMDRMIMYLEKLLDIQEKLGIKNPQLAMKSAIRGNKDASTGTKESIDIPKIDSIIDAIKTRK